MPFENGYPDVIELVPNASGGYTPDFNYKTPVAAPIERYVDPSTLPLYIEPPATPNYDSGSRGMSDADLSDFGVDQYGRPIVDRDINGKPRFNPDLDFTPDELGAANRALNDNPGNRSTRRRNGAALALGVGLVNGPLGPDDVINAAIFTGALADDIFAPIGTSLGLGLRRLLRPNAPPLPGAPSGEINVPGAGEHPQGQCETNYRISYTCKSFRTDGSSFNSEGFLGRDLPGPIQSVSAVNFYNGFRLSLVDGRGRTIEVREDISNNRKPQYLSHRLTRNDGQPDNCGERQPGLEPVTGTPTRPGEPVRYQPYPSPSPQPQPSPQPYPQPNLPPDGSPFRPGFPDDRYPDGWYDPGLDNPPWPDGIPNPDDPLDPDNPPTPNDECCPSTERSLESIKKQLEEILKKLQGEGEGLLNLIPCVPPDDEADLAEYVEKGTYKGDGLTGLYDAIAAITESLNIIHTDTKCPPALPPAALPMFYEIKHGEITQLVVIWQKLDRGSSTWSMTVPHPRDDIGANYPFAFPDYKKGGNMASVRLIDNSQIIINAFSEGEAQRVIDYLITLIDPAYIPSSGVKMIYSKNVAEYVEVEVRASYVKKFQGHKTTAPLWAKSLTSG